MAQANCKQFLARDADSCTNTLCPSCGGQFAGFCNGTCGYCFVPSKVVHGQRAAGSVTMATENPWDETNYSRNASLAFHTTRGGDRAPRLTLSSRGSMTLGGGKVAFTRHEEGRLAPLTDGLVQTPYPGMTASVQGEVLVRKLNGSAKLQVRSLSTLYSDRIIVFSKNRSAG